MQTALRLLLVLPACAWAQDFERSIAGSNGDTPYCVTWSQRELVYHVDAAGSARTPAETEFTAIDSAFATWQSRVATCSDFVFTRGSRVVNPVIGANGPSGENAITFRETSCATVNDPCTADGTCANTFHCWDHSDTTIALTTVTYSRRTGAVYDADIEFNASEHLDGSSFLFTTISNPACTEGHEAVTCTAWDVQNTATHEIGHMVGFDHVMKEGSTMAPRADLGDLGKRTLDDGTLLGFCVTYPRGQAPAPCDEVVSSRKKLIGTNTGTFGCGCQAMASPVPLLLLLALIAAIRHR